VRSAAGPASDGAAHGAVRWLTAQSFAFGFTAALVGVVANAMFLDAYGARWLPVTYLLVAAAGVSVSAGIARASRRFDLVPIAVTVLGSITAVFTGAWLLGATGDAPWVSGPLLVVFAILIGLGFTFVGMQAGRILDIAGIKARLPRIMAGFPVGAVAGGLAGGPLVTWTGRTEGLLLPTVLAQATFTTLVWATGRRFADRLARPPAPPPRPTMPAGGERRGVGRLLANPFVVLVVGYQVLSSFGSQIADYLVMDRAAARFPDSEDLARFVSGYTAVMNTAIILFLVLLAGPLMRRFGLRLGIAANPVVVTTLALVMVVVLVGSGAASLALLLTVSAARILDLVLDDGMTRTSVNALFQVLPPASRVEAQAVVEGMGVPVAIGLSGVAIILVNLLPAPLPVTIAVMVLVCAAWSGAAFALHRAYRPALADALRRRPVLDEAARVAGSAEELEAARRLAARGEPGAVRLALEVLAEMDRPAPLLDLVDLSRDVRPDLRLTALAGRAHLGDVEARGRLADEAEAALASPGTDDRVRAASALAEVAAPRRSPLLLRALADEDAGVRAAALGAVTVDDADAALGSAVGGLRDPVTAAAAAGAVRRLGEAAVPALDAALTSADASTEPWVRRLVGAVAPSAGREEVLVRHVGCDGLLLGLAVLDALAGPEAATGSVAAACDAAIRGDVDATVRLLGVVVAVDGTLADAVPDRALRRALGDELALRRARLSAALAARHGTEALADALTVLRSGGADLGVAVEAVEVVVGPASSREVVPVLDPRLGPGERLDRLGGAGHGPPAFAGPAEAVRWLVEEPATGAVSDWLRACAVASAAGHGWLPGYDLGAARRLAGTALVEQLARAGPSERIGEASTATPG
jgi:hypothetical protein